MRATPKKRHRALTMDSIGYLVPDSENSFVEVPNCIRFDDQRDENDRWDKGQKRTEMEHIITV